MSSDQSSRRGSNACSQSSLSSTGSSLTATRDLWRLRQTMHCLENCSFYHGSLNRNKAREKMRRCRPVIVHKYKLFEIHCRVPALTSISVTTPVQYGNSQISHSAHSHDRVNVIHLSRIETELISKLIIFEEPKLPQLIISELWIAKI